MIYRTIGRTIMFSQVGFPTINRHLRPDPVPMFARCPRPRLQSIPLATICATGRDPGHELASALSAAICTISRDMRRDSQENETKWIAAMTTNSGEKRLKLKE
jgi:hypothetical protein